MTLTSADLCFAGAYEQARLIRDGQITATELIEATLNRIEAVNPVLNAYRIILSERARAEATRIDAANSLTNPPLLLGVPVAVKDTIDIEGEITTWGTSANTTPADADAPIVAALRRAGAIIIGKTTCSELAAWPVTETAAWGKTRNPWNTNFGPGGSSGGSAVAVAAGLCGIAVGSDGLGSIRAPSSFTGLFGLKPQRDRVWHGPENWHGLAVNGPIARSVADAALFLDATSTDQSGPSFVQAAAEAPRPLRIAVAWKSLAKYPMAARIGVAQQNAVAETVALLTQLGHTVFERELSFSRHASSNVLIRYLAGVADSAELVEDSTELSKRTRTIASFGRRVSEKRLARARGNEQAIAAAMNKIFDDADVVLTPGALQAPLRVGQLDNMNTLRAFDAAGRIIPHYGPWNVIGQPAATIPAGFDGDGLPVSVQLAGRQSDEGTLLSLAAQLEAARPWAQHRPPLDS